MVEIFAVIYCLHHIGNDPKRTFDKPCSVIRQFLTEEACRTWLPVDKTIEDRDGLGITQHS